MKTGRELVYLPLRELDRSPIEYVLDSGRPPVDSPEDLDGQAEKCGRFLRVEESRLNRY